MLDTTCTGNPTTLQLDEGPPARSPCGPAALDALDCCRSLLAGLGLAADITHHLRARVHRVEAIEAMLSEGFKA
jgi:hypothetical protein